jgi:hypothetical protein
MKKVQTPPIEKGQPTSVPPDKVVFFLLSVKGKAHLERLGKHHILEGNKTRYPIGEGDFFWLEIGATAITAWIEKDGRIGKPKPIGKNYWEKTSYPKAYTQLTEEQYKTVRNLLSHSGNSKPLINPKIPRLLLPLSDAPVRAAYIPYHFRRGKGTQAKTITLSYLKSDEDILFGSWEAHSKGSGFVSLNRSEVIKKLQKVYGEQGNWDNETIPISLTLTTVEGKIYKAFDLNLVTDKDAQKAEQDFKALENTLKKSENLEDAIELAQLCTRLETYPTELLHRLMPYIRRHSDAKNLFQIYCSLFNLEAEEFYNTP